MNILYPFFDDLNRKVVFKTTFSRNRYQRYSSSFTLEFQHCVSQRISTCLTFWISNDFSPPGFWIWTVTFFMALNFQYWITRTSDSECFLLKPQFESVTLESTNNPLRFDLLFDRVEKLPHCLSQKANSSLQECLLVLARF